jgi:pimeloyl-ACP methyl ester carboxylesterase
MSTATIDGLEVRYQVFGSGAPLLLFAPGGFDATIEKWRAASAWTGIDALDALASQFQLIVYDRRESGQSGGRVEHLSWRTYARQAKALLDQLRIESALVLGGCMGCSVALAFAVDYPEATRALLLHWPVGGFRWKATVWTALNAITGSPAAMVCPALSSERESAKAFGQIPKPVPGPR